MIERAAWVTVRVHPGSRRDAVSAALFEAGARGLHEVGDTFVTHVRDQREANDLTSAALAASDDARVDTAPLVDVDWSELWKQGIRAQTMGRLTVAPPWLAGDLDPETTIVIDPAMAFGTGEHPTTRGVVRLMHAVIRPGDRVADLGAGSAVLAIAAAKLGASYVAAIETDPDAIGNAEENVIRNGVGTRVMVIEGDAATLLPLVAPVRVVLANIISSVLIELLPSIALVLPDDGVAILSGILANERTEMLRVFRDSGWTVEEEDQEGIWWSATITRP